MLFRSVRDCLGWAEQLKSIFGNRLNDNTEYIKGICAKNSILASNNIYCEQLKELLESIEKELNWFVGLFDKSENLLNLRLLALTERVSACLQNIAGLEDWLAFRLAKNRCTEMGLGDYIAKIEEQNVAAENIVPIFQRRFFRLWLDSVLPEFPVVANFRRWNQTQLLKEFGELDKLQFAIAKSRIRSILINSLPSLDRFTSGVDEISILKREMNKQRKIMPIRRLFSAIPNLIMTLKPCLMM